MYSRRFVNLLVVPMLLALAVPSYARDVTHIMGVTEVSDEPVRIVALTNEVTEDLLALGIVPVGAVRSINSDPWFDHVAEALSDTVIVGDELAPNLEVIVTLAPDLILGNKKRHEAIYEQLSAIAPTVYVENVTGQWRDNFAFYAETVNKTEAGRVVLADYERRVAAIQAALGSRLSETVGIVRFIAGQNYAYNNDSFSGSILRDIGFARPAPQDKAGLAEPITLERIPELDGDHLIHFSYETGDGGATQEAETWMVSPLWQNLTAVKAGNVYAVSDTVWATAGGVMAANLALDDIEAMFGLESTR